MNLVQEQMEKTNAMESDVRAKVAALPNLTDEQRECVFQIAKTFKFKTHLEPGYANIAHMVRTTKPTPTGHKAFSKGAW
jgi:hypothetical protein